MNINNVKNLLIIAGILLFAFLLIPDNIVRLFGFILCLGALIFCIIQLYRDARTTIKILAYLAGFVACAIGTAKMIVYYANTIPLVGMIVTIILVVMAWIFIIVLIVKFGQWLYRKFKHSDNAIN